MRGRRFLWAFGLAVAVLAGGLSGAGRADPPAPPPATPAPAATPTCSAPAGLVRMTKSMPRVAQRIATGQPLKIVALGSSSTFGLGASSPALTYPARLEAELRRRFPAIAITVVNKGVNGNETRDVMQRFDRDVMAEKPDLLIWQAGTNSLINQHDMWQVFLDLRDGIRRVRTLGADVIVMNPQYVPRVLARPNHAAMIDLIDVAGREINVNVFDRFNIMRAWTAEGRLRFDQFVTPDGLHMNDWGYGCIAQLLAMAIGQATPDEMVKHSAL